MRGILRERQIAAFLRQVDNPRAFDFARADEARLREALVESPRAEVVSARGTLKGRSRFNAEVRFDCPESRRNSFFADLLKMEFELREVFRRHSSAGERPSQAQNEIFQALSLNAAVFVNVFSLGERMLAFFAYLKVRLQQSGRLGEAGECVAVLAERKARKKIEAAARQTGVLGHLRLVWLDKSGALYRLGPRGELLDSGLAPSGAEASEGAQGQIEWLIVDNLELSVQKLVLVKRTIAALQTAFLQTENADPESEAQEAEAERAFSVTISGFYEGEELKAAQKLLGQSKAVLQRGYSEALGYSLRKRWADAD